MKVSACMIAKDEEKNIARGLQSMRDFVDEIIVIDTGSQDATADIARANGAAVYYYPWENDFAAAKNFALTKASGDWIVFLDADEYFAAGSGTKLRRLLAECASASEGFLVQLINIDVDQQNKVIDQFFNLRIFRNLPTIRYTGKIHEQLRKAQSQELNVQMIAPQDGFIYHTGYSTGVITAKAERNLAMLLPEYEQSKRPGEFYAYLAEAYQGVGDHIKALEYAKLDVAQGRCAITYASRSCRILIQSMQRLDRPRNEVKAAIATALQLFPEMPEFKAEYAVYCFETLEYEAAIEALQAALALKEKYSSHEPTLFNDAMAMLARQTLADWIEIQRLVKTLKISACVIAKNEAKNIGCWLNSMKLCSDEQIVLDTGSDDQTAVIARQGGAKVYQQIWANDFSQAKNAALAKATGDWVIFLDADEYFSAATVGNVRSIIAREHRRKQDVDVIMCTLVNIDSDQNNLEINRFASLRLFRRVPYLKFYGNIHESIRHENAQLCVFTENEHLEIYHTGYSSGIVERKLNRNLALLQEDIALHGEGKQHYRYLLDCYHGLGEHERAIHYAKLHLESDASSVGTESDIYRNLINSLTMLKKDPVEIAPYIETALQRFSDIPDFYAYYAGNLFRQGKKIAAKPYLLKALAIYTATTKKSLMSSSFAVILSETYSYLAEIYVLEGNPAEAKRLIRLALQDNRYNQQAFRQFYELQAADNSAAVMAALLEIYPKNRRDYAFIAEQLESCATPELHLQFTALHEAEFGEVSGLTVRCRLFQERADSNLYDLCLNEGIGMLQSLIIALLLSGDEKLYLKYREQLPAAFQGIVERYYHADRPLAAADEAAYQVLLQAVINRQDAALLSGYQMIGEDFAVAVRRQTFLTLCRNECYVIAARCLTEELLTAYRQDAEMLYYAGIASYFTQQWAAAQDYFASALQLGSRQNDLHSYLTWLEEKQ